MKLKQLKAKQQTRQNALHNNIACFHRKCLIHQESEVDGVYQRTSPVGEVVSKDKAKTSRDKDIMLSMK